MVLYVFYKNRVGRKDASRGSEHSHNKLESSQSSCIGRETSQDTRKEAPGEAPEATSFVVDVSDSIGVFFESRVVDTIDHDDVFDNVGRICRDPEARGTQPTGPEVHRRLVHRGVLGEVVGYDLIGPPPDNEVGSENHGWNQALVERPDPVVLPQLHGTVDRSRVDPALGVVLHLQPSLQLLYWRRNKRDRPTGQQPCSTMAHKWHFLLLGEEGLLHKSPVDVQRAKHDRIHHHPSHQRWGEALVQPGDPLVLESLERAVQRTREPTRRRLETDLDGVEWMANRIFHHTGEHPRYEASVSGLLFLISLLRLFMFLFFVSHVSKTSLLIAKQENSPST